MDFPGYNLNQEEDCRAASRLNDRFIRNYMVWMERYWELPARETLVLKEARKAFPESYCSYLENLGTTSWMPPPGDPTQGYGEMELQAEEYGNGQAAGDFDEGAPSEDEEDGEEDGNAGDKSLRQRLNMSANAIIWNLICIMMDWSNIYSVALQGENRKEGLQIISMLAIAVGNFHSSMYQLGAFQIQMAIHLCTKAQWVIANCIKHFEAAVKQPSLAGIHDIISTRAKTLKLTIDALDSHIRLCRKMGDSSEW